MVKGGFVNTHFDFAKLMEAYHNGEIEARVLVCIALQMLEDHVQKTTAEQFQKRYGTLGTEALAKFTVPY